MITKTAKELIANEVPAAATEVVDAAADTAKKGPVRRALGALGNAAFPALNAGFAAYGVASGDQSVGEATGEALGGWLGYELGSNWATKHWTDQRINNYKTKPGKWLGKWARNPFVGIPMATTILGASWLGGKLDKLMPWKRQAPTPYVNNQPVTYQ